MEAASCFLIRILLGCLENNTTRYPLQDKLANGCNISYFSLSSHKLKKYLLLLLALACIFISAIPFSVPFTGKIQYRYTFTDLEGNDISGQMGPQHGFEQHYFVSDSNYKSYNELNNIIQLYNARTNTYYGFGKDKTARRIDAMYRSSQQYKITKLDKKEKILGYDCVAIQVETDNTSTIYYYSPEIRINPKGFAKHNFGDFNTYLEATGGALSLKYVITYPKEGFIWTVIAQKITPMKLGTNDFEYPEGYSLQN